MQHSQVRVWLELEEDGQEAIRYELDEGTNIATVLGLLSFVSQAVFLQQHYDTEEED